MSHLLEAEQVVNAPLEDVFAFFAAPQNLARITPDWLDFRIVGPEEPVMAPGLEIEYRIRPLGLPRKWISRITAYDPPRLFIDEQVHGPYRSWQHLHAFEALPPDAADGAPPGDGAGAGAGGGAGAGSGLAERTRIRDRVVYELPLGPLGRAAHALFVRRRLEAIFEHRRRVIGDVFG